jgi:hypothetical protein
MVSNTGSFPVTRHNRHNRHGVLFCLQNISETWKMPIVSKELLDFVPDVINRKVFTFKDFDVG